MRSFLVIGEADGIVVAHVVRRGAEAGNQPGTVDDGDIRRYYVVIFDDSEVGVGIDTHGYHRGLTLCRRLRRRFIDEIVRAHTQLTDWWLEPFPNK